MYRLAAVAAAEAVVVSGQHEHLDGGEAVAPGLSFLRARILQVHTRALGGAGVEHPVATGTAPAGVGTQATLQPVVVCQAEKGVLLGSAPEPVALLRAPDLRLQAVRLKGEDAAVTGACPI